MKKKMIIIGGGISGIYLSILLKKYLDIDVVVLEANDKPLKKLLATGNGRGSLTVVSNFSLTKSLKTLIISMLLSFFIVKFAKINVLIWANVCYNRHRR